MFLLFSLRVGEAGGVGVGGGGGAERAVPCNVLYCILTLYLFTLGHVWKLANAPMRI